MNSVSSNAVAVALGGSALKYKDIQFNLNDLTFSNPSGRTFYYCNLLKSDYFNNNDILLNACIITWNGAPFIIPHFDNLTDNLSLKTLDLTMSSSAYIIVRYLYIEG